MLNPAKYRCPAICAVFFVLALTACATPEPAPPNGQTPTSAVPKPRAVPTGFQKISAGTNTCGLRNDGTLQCWGLFGWERQMEPNGRFADVSVGADHTCALSTTGEVTCWGYKSHIEGTPTSDGFTAISAGLANTCALNASGNIHCWGPDSPLLQGIPKRTFASLDIGEAHVGCALTEPGEVQCWGDPENPILSAPDGLGFTNLTVGYNHACVTDASGALSCWGDAPAIAPLPDEPVVAVAAGTRHTCVAQSSGITCRGAQNARNLSVPTADRSWRSIDGSMHFCAVDDAGKAACWGDNSRAQTQVPEDRRYLQVTNLGSEEVCALRQPAELQCWGTSPGRSDDHWTPPIELTPEHQLVGRGAYVCALSPAGKTTCWGEFQHEFDIPDSERFVELDADQARLCGTRADQTVQCYGWLGHTNDEHPPTDAKIRAVANQWGKLCWIRDDDGSTHCYSGSGPRSSGDPVDIVTNYDFTCTLDRAGRIACSGEVEDVPKEAGFTDIVAGARFACALDAEKRAVCWGDDQAGQTTPPVNARFSQLSAGFESVCGLRPDGGVECWGERSGQRELMRISLDP